MLSCIVLGNIGSVQVHIVLLWRDNFVLSKTVCDGSSTIKAYHSLFPVFCTNPHRMYSYWVCTFGIHCIPKVHRCIYKIKSSIQFVVARHWCTFCIQNYQITRPAAAALQYVWRNVVSCCESVTLVSKRTEPEPAECTILVTESEHSTRAHFGAAPARWRCRCVLLLTFNITWV